MSNPREALEQRLLKHSVERSTGEFECGCAYPVEFVFEEWDEWAVHVAEDISREFLVVPRSDIVGTEYGYRHAPDMPVFTCAGNVGAAIERVAEIREAQRRRGWSARAEALEHPVLPWTPIRPEARDA